MKRILISMTILAVAGLFLSGCGGETPPPPKPKKQVKVKPEAKPKAAKPAKEKVAKLGTPAYLDAKNGFRDVTFGMTSDRIPGLVLLEEDASHQLKTYTRPNEDLQLGKLPLTKIEYTFFENKLCQVTLYWNLTYPASTLRVPPTTDLAGNCARLYGHPAKRSTTKDSTYFVWRSKKTGLMLTELRLPGVVDQIRGDWALPPATAGEMVIYSQPLRRNASALIASHVANMVESM